MTAVSYLFIFRRLRQVIFDHVRFAVSDFMAAVLPSRVRPRRELSSTSSARSPRAGRSGNRILARGRYFAHVQTGSGAFPAFYTMNTGSLSQGAGIKRPGRDIDHPVPSKGKR